MNSICSKPRTCSAFLLAIFLWLHHMPATGQNDQTPPQFIPPSPNAYSLGKYGDVPVSLYTGVPDITIPIWTLRERDLLVDVSLSYHGSGIKVDEVASWVGLGWVINAGGVITRKIRSQAEHVISDGSLRPLRANIDFYSGSDYHNELIAFIQEQQLQAAANGSLDTEPDEYFFNFMGRSGKFYFNEDGEAILYKHEALDIKLRYVSADLGNDIIITAENGTVYEFCQRESTFFPTLSQTHTTTWYLTKVKSPNGSEITFEYQGLPSVRHNIRESSHYQAELQTATQTQIVPPIGPHSDMTVTELQIKKIITDDGWIEFNLGTQLRQDYESASYPLESIIVYRENGAAHRKFKLSTSYFEANNAEKYDGIMPENFNHLNFRLRLDAVQEFASDDTPAKPAYRFEYWGDDDPNTDDVYTLPYRLSPNQDHWGYFNNADNEHIFPGNSEGRPITSESWYVWNRESVNITVTNTLGNGANREPDAEAVKACALKSVHYPTGGYTDYFFETNKWNDTYIGGGLRIHKIAEHTGTTQAKETYFDYNFRATTIDPRDLYYKVYRILWVEAPIGQWSPSEEMLANFGLTTPDGERDADMIKISTYPQAVLGGVSPGYGSVTVYQPGTGSTKTTFDTHFNFPDYYGIDDVYDEIDMFEIQGLFDSQFISAITYPGLPSTGLTKTGVNDWPYPETYDNTWKRGLITGRWTYSENMNLLRRETFNYKRVLLDAIPAYKVRSWQNDQSFAYSKYYIPHAWINLEEYIVEQYDENGENPVITTTEYYHDNLLHTQPNRQIVNTSDGKSKVTVISYPSDYASGTEFIDDMKANHLLAYPIEQVTYLDDGSNQVILSGNVSLFKTGGKGLKDQDLILETPVPVPLASFRFSNRAAAGELPPSGTASTFSQDSRYRPRILYNSYDEMGNLREYSSSNGVRKSYKWGYQQSKPVAEVVNAQNNEFLYENFEESAASGVTEDAAVARTGLKYFSGDYVVSFTRPNARNYTIEYWYLETNGKWQHIAKPYTVSSMTLSEGSGIDDVRIYPTDALMTNYTYDPVVGVTSMTDQNCSTTFYEYNELGRLEVVKDSKGHVVKSYIYHFKQQ